MSLKNDSIKIRLILLFFYESRSLHRVMPSPSPEELSHQITHERDDKKALVIASGVVFLTVASLAVFLRLIARRLAHTVLKQDDWWIVGALV